MTYLLGLMMIATTNKNWKEKKGIQEKIEAALTTTTLASSACDGPPPTSAFTIVTTQANHVVKIDRYSKTLSANCKTSLSSSSFRAGDHTWHINYRRTGSSDISKDYISFSLVLEDLVDKAVMGQATFSLLDQNRNSVPSHTRSVVFNFSLGSNCFGFNKFIRRKDLEQSEHLKDDCFAIGVHVVINKYLARDSSREGDGNYSTSARRGGKIWPGKVEADV
uniref:MATH domain-containing protein n=1 Tax=Leersia perrieri TaxID=77586 RepID=A0A0D9XK17_9ORYZ